MKKLLSYLFTKRATLVDMTVMAWFILFVAGGQIFISVVTLLVGVTFSAVMEMKHGGAKPMLTFGVDSHGNPSVRYAAGFASSDAEVLNKYANASVNQFKATLYARLQKLAEMEKKGKKFSVGKFTESLEKDYPVVAIQ